VLSTVHGSKGLESTNVCVVGLSDGLFPMCDESCEYDEEELRLLYVSVTRAKENLLLTGCKQFGSKTFTTHSFIDMVKGEQK
jgi:DNA helicase-2/ATP-dependent DNA helicase PcrA